MQHARAVPGQPGTRPRPTSAGRPITAVDIAPRSSFASGLGVDLDRVHAYIASGPRSLPRPELLLNPGPHAHGLLWPLVARRNLKRLLSAFAAARTNDPAVAANHRAVVVVLMAMTDDQLDHLCTEPEVTSWLAGLDDPSSWDGHTYFDGLTPVVISNAAAAGIDTEPVPVAVDGGLLSLRPLGVDVSVGDGRVHASSAGGHVQISGRRRVISLTRHGAGWTAEGASSMPRTYAGAVVKGLPQAWLRSSFPDLQNVAEDPGVAVAIADRVREGLHDVEVAWPEMALEIASLLRWVVPMSDGDSFFVPAFRGLVALPEARAVALAFNVVHELSHNVMSCIYDLVDILGNPDDRVRSPFSRELEPLSSVIHSCWAFSHELRAVRALLAVGRLDPAVDWDRLQLKIRVFYDRALPVIRANARLTPYGSELLALIESIVYNS